MKIGLYFGSFNPVHVGHMVIAGFMAEYTNLDQVWLVVSPQNPLKAANSLLQDHHRLRMVEIAIGDYPKLKASRIEFDLPRPSYTVTTLAYLQDKHPEHAFVLIMGTDTLGTLGKWKDYQVILDNYRIFTYPRPLYSGGPFHDHPSVSHYPAPIMEISSSFIREGITAKKDIRYMLPEAVWKYLDEMNFYR